MANIQHTDLTHSQVHEPRWITINGTGSSGYVITNSSSVAGESEYRKLKFSDIDEKDFFFTMKEINSTTAQTHYWPCDFSGTIVKWKAVVDNPLVTSSNTYELRIDGVQVTGTPITFATGGAAGDQQSANATAANTFSTGDNIQIVGTTIGNTDTTVDTVFVVTVRKA